MTPIKNVFTPSALLLLCLMSLFSFLCVAFVNNLANGAIAAKANVLAPRGSQLDQAIKPSVESSGTVQTNADEPEVVYFEQDPQSWARVKRIVNPVYPEIHLKNGIGGVVDIEVLIDVLGYVREVRSIVSTPANNEFETVIRQGLKYWLFNVPSTPRCVPIEAVGAVRLTFEVVDAMPKITLMHRNPLPVSTSSRLAPKMVNRDSITEQITGRFPVMARRAGAQANVYLLLNISHETGELMDAEVTHVVTLKDYEKMFAHAAMQSVRNIKYLPRADQTMPWRTCMVIAYRLKGSERVDNR